MKKYKTMLPKDYLESLNNQDLTDKFKAEYLGDFSIPDDVVDEMLNKGQSFIEVKKDGIKHIPSSEAYL